MDKHFSASVLNFHPTVKTQHTICDPLGAVEDVKNSFEPCV